MGLVHASDLFKEKRGIRVLNNWRRKREEREWVWCSIIEREFQKRSIIEREFVCF